MKLVIWAKIGFLTTFLVIVSNIYIFIPRYILKDLICSMVLFVRCTGETVGRIK